MQFIDLTLQFCANMPFRKKWLGAPKNQYFFNEMQTNYAQWQRNLSPHGRNCGYRNPGNYCLSPRIQQGFGIRNPAEIDNNKLIRPVVFLRDQVARSPLQFPQERSLVVESR